MWETVSLGILGELRQKKAGYPVSRLRPTTITPSGDNSPEKLTLVATGALTNVALLLRLYAEDMRNCVDKIVIMGGAIGTLGIR